VRLEDYPTVKPLSEQRHALQARLQAVEEQISTARQTVYAAESHAASIAFPVRVARDARRQIEELTVEAEAMRADLATLTEELEAAKRTAIAELRPYVDAETIQVLLKAEEAMEALLTAQGAMQALSRRAQRLGVGAPVHRLLDHFLPYRLKLTRETIATLHARQG
jgi:chromosome segregation ATPase